MIEVIDPPISPLKKGGRIPHTFKDNNLCVHKRGEWDSTKLIQDTIIPWVSLWLYYYEIWKITGEWLGGGHQVNSSHNKPETYVESKETQGAEA